VSREESILAAVSGSDDSEALGQREQWEVFDWAISLQGKREVASPCYAQRWTNLLAIASPARHQLSRALGLFDSGRVNAETPDLEDFVRRDAARRWAGFGVRWQGTLTAEG
jgi:hypothetical protein